MQYYLLFISHSWEEGNLCLKFFLALLMGILPRSDIGMGFAASVRGSEVNGSGKGEFHHGKKEEREKKSQPGSKKQRHVDRRLGNYSCYRMGFLGERLQKEIGGAFSKGI